MKNIVVVGGSGGLGNAVVAALLDRSYQVAVAGRKPASDPRTPVFHCIETIAADWPALYRQIERGTKQPIDAVVFVSGTAAYGKVAEIPAETARQMMELNFWSCAAAAQAAGEYWSLKHRPGKFLAVLSITARIGVPFESYYSASKAAAARYLECLNLEYGDRGIEFISAFPGTLKTPFRSSAPWFGIKPEALEGGADPAQTAQALIALLEGHRHSPVIGWRERAIDLAERLWPGLYNLTIQRKRVRAILQKQEPVPPDKVQEPGAKKFA
jgi:NAD(P)-dependent dehydrogenase (short-subunit alcohol dehydrogenase family)